MLLDGPRRPAHRARLGSKAGAVLAAALLALASPPAPAAAGEEPKYRNPSPAFHPLSPEEEARLAPEKLGPEPSLTDDEWKELQAGGVATHRLPQQRPDEKGLRYEAFGLIDATPREVMSFLRDYEARPKYVPNTKDAKVRWDGNLAVVDFTVDAPFTTLFTRVQFLHYDDAVVEWEYLEGDLRDSSGHFKLFPRDGGARTLFVYRLYSDSGTAVPDFIVAPLTAGSLPGMIEGVRRGVQDRKGR